MAITLLPTPPTRQDPVNFNVRADEFLGALPTFGTEANSLATDVNNKQVTVSNAATAATNAASTATTKAGEAEASADAADLSAQAANTAKLAAEAVLDSFDDRYLGAKATDPATDNDGNPLIIGALYFRTTAPVGMKVLAASGWDDAYANLSSKYDKTGGAIDGNVLVTGVLGYGVGAGGTVVQATSKTTQVTLNKSCGKIITHAQSLAPGQSILFDSLNTFANECVCVVNIDTPTPFYWDYKVDAIAVGEGKIIFRLTNLSPAARGDNVVIDFALFKIAIT